MNVRANHVLGQLAAAANRLIDPEHAYTRRYRFGLAQMFHVEQVLAEIEGITDALNRQADRDQGEECPHENHPGDCATCLADEEAWRAGSPRFTYDDDPPELEP